MNFMLIRFVCQAISARKRAAVFNAGCPNSQKTPKRPITFLLQSALQNTFLSGNKTYCFPHAVSVDYSLVHSVGLVLLFSFREKIM